uniref:RIMS-binding protein 2 n=1 Tax=Denticeps clupeoides TaxID=299321 RepID=A0AAY4AYL7_9TELE
MRDAAERRQQLEVEHEQALAVLNAKQQEIDLLQKAQVEAKKEHEGAVHLLEAKVRELEEKCRTQSEQFNLLSKELEKFRLQAGSFDIISSSTLTVNEAPASPGKSLSQLLNGLAAPAGKGLCHMTLLRSVVSEVIRPLQVSGEKGEFLSVKQSFLSRSQPSSPRRFLTEMDKELSPTPRSKPRYSGKVRLCVARYNYNPYDGPNENPEAELPLVAGRYLYVYGTMDEDGFYEGELLDGQQGLVPSNFVDFLQEDDVLSVPPSERSIKETAYLNHSPAPHATSTNGMGTLDVSIDEVGEDIVPYPRRINLIKQLAKSVIVGWEPPVVPPGWGVVSAYNVLVDREVRMTVPLGGRTKALIEKLNLATTTHRISIQSVTERGLSDELRCTLLVGKDVVVAPYYLRVENITPVSAELSWMPSNSNYSHTIFLNESEYDVMKPGSYRYHFYNLKPMTVYMVRLVARPHQMPWQLPLEQREKREISVEFCTQHAGPPHPPQEVQVLIGQNPGVLQVRWKPPALTPSGTSNGASVIGYAVCTKGQKIAEVLYPTADYVTVELNRIQGLEAREVVVRTLSVQGESQDSPVATIPHIPPYPQTYPPTHPQPHIQSMPHTLPHVQPHAHPPPPAREIHTKEQDGLRRPWDHPASPVPRAPSPLPPPGHSGRTLEPPHIQGRRSPSPQRILPQPQGTPMTNTYYTESSRGSDLSDILEEDEEELYSEMQLEEGRRRSINSHNTLKILGNSSALGRSDRMDHSRRRGHGCAPPQRRPMMVPSIDGYGGRNRRSPDYYDESELEDLVRVFVALFDYDPLSMSPNPDAAVEELPFKEGQIIKVYGDKDTDGFYRADIGGRPGLIPCNMVSEIQTEDDDMIDQLLKQGFLPLNTPVEKIERNRRSGRQHPVSTCRMVALYDYDPRESSPNVDVEAELTFCAGDVITVFGEIDEDGFYYGELNGHRGLVPSNFLEEVPEDVEVYLTDTPSRYAQDHPARTKTKRKKSVHFTP